jgi:hypothetical protein
VIISHDRWFLDRIATHILAFEGDSHVEWFEGNFQAYEGRPGKEFPGPLLFFLRVWRGASGLRGEALDDI